MTPPPDPGTTGPGEAASELGMPPSSSPPHPAQKAAALPKKVKILARGDADPDPALALMQRVVESTLENSDEAAPIPVTSAADSDLPPDWLQQAVRDIFALKVESPANEPTLKELLRYFKEREQTDPSATRELLHHVNH